MMSQANMILISYIQNSPLPALLDDLSSDVQSRWLVHNDLKGSNLLVARTNTRLSTSVLVVDWESGGLGDRAWDVGSILADFLAAWILSIPVPTLVPSGVEALSEGARNPLQVMRPTISEFWSGYSSELPTDTAEHLLERAVQFSGARLLQTAFELTQFERYVGAAALHLLQVALNLLQSPPEAGIRMLGLFGGSRIGTG